MPTPIKEIDLDLEEVGQADFNMPQAKIELAKCVLLCLFLLIIAIYACSFFPENIVPERAKKLSENIYQSVVPVVSMILGYYFAKD